MHARISVVDSEQMILIHKSQHKREESFAVCV